MIRYEGQDIGCITQNRGVGLVGCDFIHVGLSMAMCRYSLWNKEIPVGKSQPSGFIKYKYVTFGEITTKLGKCLDQMKTENGIHVRRHEAQMLLLTT